MKHLILVSCMGLLGLSLLLGGSAITHCGKCAADGKKIAAKLDADQFTLAKAVTAAETHSKGRAISAVSAVSETGEVMLHVFCMTGDKLVMCHVNTADGTVKGMKDAQEFPTLSGAHEHGEDHQRPGAGAGHEGHGG